MDESVHQVTQTEYMERADILLMATLDNFIDKCFDSLAEHGIIECVVAIVCDHALVPVGQQECCFVRRFVRHAGAE